MRKKALFIVGVLFGLVMINSGLNKFFNYMPAPKEMPEKMLAAMKAYMEIGWLIPLVGVAEVLGGLLLIFPRTRALGAIVILPVLTGILLSNISTSSNLLIVFALIAIILWVIIDSWDKYLPMIQPSGRSIGY